MPDAWISEYATVRGVVCMRLARALGRVSAALRRLVSAAISSRSALVRKPASVHEERANEA